MLLIDQKTRKYEIPDEIAERYRVDKFGDALSGQDVDLSRERIEKLRAAASNGTVVEIFRFCCW